MTLPYFFGYGSLVNTGTHDFPGPERARLSGWRRAWRHTDDHTAPFLTVIRDDTCTIEGLIAHVPNNDWDALDQREWAYDRINVTNRISHTSDQTMEIAVYSVPDLDHRPVDPARPILMSYLDVVIQGYAQQFGPGSVARFVDTTDGWDTPILNDRANPQYPRHQTLSTTETALVDAALKQVSAQVIDLA